MERAEFQEKLAQLSALAKEKENCLSVEEVRNFLKELPLSEEQLKLVYEYLAASQITIKGYVPEQSREELPYTKEEQSFLQTYQEELKAIDRMEEGALQALLCRAEEGDDLAKAQATEQLLYQVLEQAKGFHGKGLALEDLVQEGNVGLMLSMETLGLRAAETTALDYIHTEVERALQDALEEAVSVRREGNQIADKVNQLSDSIQKLTDELERQVTLEELAVFLDMDIEEIEGVLKLAGDGVELADQKEPFI